MPNNLILILILAAIGVVMAIVAGYYVVRFMRGSIKITMVRTGYNAGETITGSFELHTKKPIEGNKLTVSLICQEVTRTRRGGKTRTHTEEVYRDEKIIEEARMYHPGHKATHQFEIKAPDFGSGRVPAEVTDSPVFQAIGMAARFLGSSRSYLKWRVEARLDAKGVDLAASKKVTVNVGRLM
jgi:hypothetical protein